jgi:AcrR family transcriptional regulator
MPAPGFVTSKTTSGRGRRRDPDKDGRVLEAARELLAEGGYAAATIPAVARRAGVGAPTVYRRWASQAELIESALAQRPGTAMDEGTKSFDAYLKGFVEEVVAYFANAAVRAAVPGLLVEYHRDPRLYDRLLAHGEEPIRKQFRAAHRRAVTDGSIARTPTADALFDTIVGTAIYHGIWRRSADNRLVTLILSVARAATRRG